MVAFDGDGGIMVFVIDTFYGTDGDGVLDVWKSREKSPKSFLRHDKDKLEKGLLIDVPRYPRGVSPIEMLLLILHVCFIW